MFEGGEPCILVFSARLLAAGRPIRERLQSNRESPAVQGDVAARACGPEPKGRFFSNLIGMDPRDAWLPGRFHRTDSWSDVAPMRCRMTGRSARSPGRTTNLVSIEDVQSMEKSARKISRYFLPGL